MSVIAKLKREAQKQRKKTKISKSKRRTEADEETLRRFFGDLPVVDADESLRIITNADDIRTAVRKDPRRCVFAQACRRLFGATTVLIFRSVACVRFAGRNGKRTVYNSQSPRLYVNVWKAGCEGRGISRRLSAEGTTTVDATGSQTAIEDDEKVQRERLHQERRNPAYIKGHAISVAAADHELRSVGSGLVQMIKTGRPLRDGPADIACDGEELKRKTGPGLMERGRSTFRFCCSRQNSTREYAHKPPSHTPPFEIITRPPPAASRVITLAVVASFPSNRCSPSACVN